MIPRKKVLLIGWDAADWKVINPLIDAGKMPNVERLVGEGSVAHIATLHPPLSPMLWTSIATGKRPFKHGIHGFTEPTSDGLGVQPVTNLSRTCKAVWNILNQNDLKSVVIGWWPSHPAEPINGVMISDHYHRARGKLEKVWPVLPGTIHPPERTAELAELRLHWSEIVGEMIEPFVPRASEIDQKHDHRLRTLATTLAECVSIHSAATWLIEREPWDFFAVYYDALDHFCHSFMRYHPPKQDQVKQEDFDLYQGVVSMAYQFHDQMLGALLGKVGEDVTVILMSDHGFHPDHLRPKVIPSIPAGPAIEHRDFGILAIRGPGIKRDELIHGASVLDITPTLLSLFGLPTGDDMDGKVLVQAFEQPPEPATVPSWDDIPGRDGRHPPHTRLDPVASREALEQLVALGYIDRPDDDREKAVAQTLRELRYNLGEAYQDADRHAEALDIFRELHQADPDEQRFAVHRFISCQALELLDEMRSIVADLDGRRRKLFLQAQAELQGYTSLIKQRMAEREAPEGRPETAQEILETVEKEALPEPQGESEPKKQVPILTPEEQKEFARWRNLSRFQPAVIDYLMAQVLAAEGNPAAALERLENVRDTHLARPGLFLQTARLYMKLRRWAEAEAVFGKALEVDPDNPHGHLGMCLMHLHRRDYAAAAHSALTALGRLYHYPLAHFHLGTALSGMRDYSRAGAAFRQALSINPHFPAAHLRLAVCLGRTGEKESAMEHFQLYRELRANARKSKADAAPEPASVSVPQTAPAFPFASTPASTTDQPAVGEGMVIVSGLPRSGTSMLMQMLAAGGHSILTDGLREADEDNPLGYFEYEPVRQLHRDSAWFKEMEGRAVKIVAPLLRWLPPDSACHVIFIERALEEVLASQSRMLERRGEAVSDLPGRLQRLKTEYARSVYQIKEYLVRRPKTRVLFLEHAMVLRNPLAAATAMNKFLGGKLSLNAMVNGIKPSLHRHRV